MSNSTDNIRLTGLSVGEVLGVGGMGTVYRARQLEFDRDVAVKVIHPHLARDNAFRDRFRSEMRIAISLQHPHIVPVYMTGEDGGHLYIVMGLVPGRDLATRISETGALDQQQAVEIVGQIGSALDEAHSRRIVHRDVKPQNVLVDDRVAHSYLTDFGLARSLDASRGFTATGHWMGTLDYVSPEQIDGLDVDERADVYSLACLLYAALTGERPFKGQSDASIIREKLRGPSSPTLEELGFSGAISDVVERGQAESPRDRFSSAGGFAMATRNAVSGSAGPHAELDTRPISRDAAGTRQMETATQPIEVPHTRTRRFLSWIAIGAVAIAGAAAAIVLTDDDPDTNQSATEDTTSRGPRVFDTPLADERATDPAALSKGGGFELHTGALYTADIPSGWTPETIDEENSGRYTSQWRDPTDSNTSVLIDAHGEGFDRTPLDTADEVRAQTSETPGYEELVFRQTFLRGVPAAEWIFDVSGDRRVDYFFESCGLGVAVLGSTSPTRFASMKPTFERVAASLIKHCG